MTDLPELPQSVVELGQEATSWFCQSPYLDEALEAIAASPTGQSWMLDVLKASGRLVPGIQLLNSGAFVTPKDARLVPAHRLYWKLIRASRHVEERTEYRHV